MRKVSFQQQELLVSVDVQEIEMMYLSPDVQLG